MWVCHQCFASNDKSAKKCSKCGEVPFITSKSVKSDTKETDSTRFIRCKYAVGDVFTDIMKVYMLNSNIPVETLHQCIKLDKNFMSKLSSKEKTIVEKLSSDSFKGFSISLMYKIARHPYFAMIIPDKPTHNWGSIPQRNENTVGDNIERIRRCKLELQCNLKEAMTETDYREFFSSLLDVSRRADSHLQNHLKKFEYRIEHYSKCVLDNNLKQEEQLDDIEEFLNVATHNAAYYMIEQGQAIELHVDIKNEALLHSEEEFARDIDKFMKNVANNIPILPRTFSNGEDKNEAFIQPNDIGFSAKGITKLLMVKNKDNQFETPSTASEKEVIRTDSSHQQLQCTNKTSDMTTETKGIQTNPQNTIHKDTQTINILSNINMGSQTERQCSECVKLQKETYKMYNEMKEEIQQVRLDISKMTMTNNAMLERLNEILVRSQSKDSDGYLLQMRSESDESDYQEIDDVNEPFIRQYGRSRSMSSLDICDTETVDWIRQKPNVTEYKRTHKNYKRKSRPKLFGMRWHPDVFSTPHSSKKDG